MRVAITGDAAAAAAWGVRGHPLLGGSSAFASFDFLPVLLVLGVIVVVVVVIIIIIIIIGCVCLPHSGFPFMHTERFPATRAVRSCTHVCVTDYLEETHVLRRATHEP
jgi:hypothetical protein